MRSFLTLLVLALLPLSAGARIGETSDQCIARYGAVVYADSATGMLLFHRAGFAIGVLMHDGKCEAIRFEKLEKDAINTAAEITDAEIQTLLASNAGGRTWTQTADKGLTHAWTRHDGEAMAVYDVIDHTFLITTIAATQRAAAKAKAKEERNLEGF